jgi:hypothetical protein
MLLIFNGTETGFMVRIQVLRYSYLMARRQVLWYGYKFYDKHQGFMARIQVLCYSYLMARRQVLWYG